jgi:CDP-diacylglycerol--serine O-phosphatidyltransferase
MGKFRLRGKMRHRREERVDKIPLRSIVPNLITSIAACAGITSITFAAEGRFLHAMWALFVACICDGIDGRVARMLKASSKLGAELDSLADFVNFGVAPAMFMYFWLTGKTVGVECAASVGPMTVRFILGCSLFYALCDCFRLARFNTMLEQETKPYWKHYFTGVPAPGGCWMVLTPAILALAFENKGVFPGFVELMRNPVVGMFMLLFIGALMASRLPTISLKAVRIPRNFMPVFFSALLLLIAFLVSNFWLTLGVVGALYVLTIPLTCWLFVRGRAKFERSNPA